MPKYVDGFVLPVPQDKTDAYFEMAAKAGAIWREHGALEYRECLGDDLDVPMGLPFPKGIQTNSDETVIFAWIVYKSREDRDRVNAAVMKDPRMNEMCQEDSPMFDCQRMLYGGFEVRVDV